MRSEVISVWRRILERLIGSRTVAPQAARVCAMALGMVLSYACQLCTQQCPNFVLRQICKNSESDADRPDLKGLCTIYVTYGM